MRIPEPLRKPWGDPGVTEQQLIAEDSIAIPGGNGGVATRTLQRAGYIRKLRMYAQAKIDQSAATGAPGKTAYGPFAGLIRRIRVEAAGRQPLFTLSGLGATVYNEIQNRDGSMLALPAFQAAHAVAEATPLVVYTTPATGAVTYLAKFPIELGFSLPVYFRGVPQELGLWLLQDRSVDLGVEVEFNPPIDAAAANVNRLYSGGTGLVAPYDLAATKVDLERELYAVPQSDRDRPTGVWAHQVTEYEQAIAGGFARFEVPAAGLLLRVTIITVDANGALVEYTDVKDLSVIYGTNQTPIRRQGWALTQEFAQDYHRMPPKGVVSLDFYKWGMDTLKLAKDSEVLANFRIETNYTALTAGKQFLILDTLQRVIRQGQ